jgi:hypothetical protein
MGALATHNVRCKSIDQPYVVEYDPAAVANVNDMRRSFAVDLSAAASGITPHGDIESLVAHDWQNTPTQLPGGEKERERGRGGGAGQLLLNFKHERYAHRTGTE